MVQNKALLQEINKIKKTLSEIKARNKNVQTDKAWETSNFRKFLICIFTYFSIGIYLNFIKIENPWLNAIVPTLGFMFSTMTFPFFKSLWIKYFYKK